MPIPRKGQPRLYQVRSRRPGPGTGGVMSCESLLWQISGGGEGRDSNPPAWGDAGDGSTCGPPEMLGQASASAVRAGRSSAPSSKALEPRTCQGKSRVRSPAPSSRPAREACLQTRDSRPHPAAPKESHSPRPFRAAHRPAVRTCRTLTLVGTRAAVLQGSMHGSTSCHRRRVMSERAMRRCMSCPSTQHPLHYPRSCCPSQLR